MNSKRRATPSVTFGAVMVAAVLTSQCGGSNSSTTPTPTTGTLASVALGATSLAAGTSGTGTITLSAAAPAGGVSVSLSSSNPGVATVATPVTVAAGASSTPFTVTAVSAGTATITAAISGSNSQSAALTVTSSTTVTLVALSLGATSVSGGSSVNGTVTLSGAAPAAGATVALSGGDPIVAPPNVVVPAGSLTANFVISTRAVSGTVSAVLTGSYAGTSASATLSVTRPVVATASFGVSGPTETETCELADSGNTLNCTFNGSTSTAPGNIIAWDWTYSVAKTRSQTTAGPVLARPAIDCSLLPPPPLPAGSQWFTLIISLKVHDDLGNVSEELFDRSARLLPQGMCGF